MTTDQDSTSFVRFDPKQAPVAVPVTVTPLRGTVSMLEGSGGNSTVSAGPEGVFLVDTFYPVMEQELRRALVSLSSAPVRFAAITHWHPDHTGNNEALARTGTVIIGHDNAWARSRTAQYIAEEDIEFPAGDASARPGLTSREPVTVHLGGEQIDVVPLAPSHSDSDAFVVFREANVIAAGDLYFNGFYPLIDTNGGGTIDGTIAEVRHLIELTDAETIVVAGHGPLGTRASLATYLEMLETVRDRTAAAAAGGRSPAEVLAAKPSAEFDATWGWGMVAPDTFVTSILTSLPAEVTSGRAS